MSLKPQIRYKVPPETERVARAIFPEGNLYMKMYDTFGILFEDQDFAALFAKRLPCRRAMCSANLEPGLVNWFVRRSTPRLFLVRLF